MQNIFKKTQFPLAVCLPFLHLLMGWLFGLCDFSWGARAFDGSAKWLGVDFGAYFLVAYCFVAWPLLKWVDAPNRSRWSVVGRAVALLLFAGPPFFSFLFFLGGFRNFLEAHEAFIVFAPAVLLGFIGFLKTGSPAVFALLVSVMTYLPLFVANDILLPIKVLVSVSAKGPEFYFLQIVGSVVAVTVATAGGEAPLSERLRNYSQAALVWVLYGIVSNLCVPIGLAWQAGLPSLTWVTLNPTWINLIALSYFLHRPGKKAYGFVIAISVIELGRFIYEFLPFMPRLRLEYWDLLHFSESGILLSICVGILALLLSPRHRAQFLSSSEV